MSIHIMPYPGPDFHMLLSCNAGKALFEQGLYKLSWIEILQVLNRLSHTY